MKAEYEHSIVNLSNSILQYYQVIPLHSTLTSLDQALLKKPKHLVLLILDGMGNEYINQYLTDGILRKHRKEVIRSVFPCTTTAAIKSYESGLTPYEHGWLGWTLYFPKQNRYMNMLPYLDETTKEVVEDLSMREMLAFEPIFTKIYRASPNVHQHVLYPNYIKNYYDHVTYHGYDDFNQMCETIESIVKVDEPSFTYVYNVNPDSLEHEFGPKSEKVKEFMEMAQSRIETLVQQMEGTDTTFVICADHGQVDIEKHIKFYEYPEFNDLLRLRPYIEPRCWTFAVQEGKFEQFKERFLFHFQDDYILYTKEEFLNTGLLGHGKRHPMVDVFLQDFIALAKTKVLFDYRPDAFVMNGHHAGSLPEENEIPLIIFNL